MTDDLEVLLAEFEFADDYMEEMRLRAKRYKQPEDPGAWLNQVEELFGEKLPKLPPELHEEFSRRAKEQLRLARRHLAAGDSDGLAVAVMLLYENLKATSDNIRLHRDNARQDATRKPRRKEIDDWIIERLTEDAGAKSPALWGRAPDWITDQIGYDRFTKRVTGARKKLNGRK